MAPIAVPEKFVANLHDLAAQDHRAVEEVVDEAINAYLVSRYHEPQLTTAEVDRLKRGIAQLDCGAGISGEEVIQRFDNWRDRRAAR